MAVRGVTTVAQPPWTRPRSPASSGLTSQNISGCSSQRWGSVRLIPPAVWCSVRRYVVQTYGKTSDPGPGPWGAYRFPLRGYSCRAGLACWP